MRRLARALGVAVLATIISAGTAPGDPPSNKSQPSPGGYPLPSPNVRMGGPGPGASGPMQTRWGQPAGLVVVPGAGYGASYVVPYYGAAPNYALPPVFLPADVLYGPDALERSLGLDNPGSASAGRRA